MTPRAAPLRADERRAAIVEAALPLVLRKGMRVTSRELAEAAGVAEGTLFRVFGSKEDLILHAARSVFSRAEHLPALAAIERSAPLERRLVEVMRIWQDHVRRIMAVLVVFSTPEDRARLGDPSLVADPRTRERADRLVAELLCPDVERLRLPVAEVVRILGGLALMSVHPAEVGPPLTAEDVVDLVLHGIIREGKPLDPDVASSATIDPAAAPTGRPTGDPAAPTGIPTKGHSCSGD